MLGVDTSLVQVMSAVSAPEACPGMAVAFSGVHTVFSSHFGYLCNEEIEAELKNKKAF